MGGPLGLELVGALYHVTAIGTRHFLHQERIRVLFRRETSCTDVEAIWGFVGDNIQVFLDSSNIACPPFCWRRSKIF